MAILEEYEDDIREELTLDVPAEYRDLQAVERKVALSELSERYVKGRLNLQPEFQREFVWDDKRASRFVESLMLNLPVPPIFVAENDDGTSEVVDGHQRLQSVFGFLRAVSTAATPDKFVPVSFKALRLKGLEVLDDLNGQGVEHLPPTQREALLARKLTVISIPKTADPDLRFVLFERLNLGSVPLNAQELRNCIYRGAYNNLIRQLASDARALAFFGRKTAGKRMKERELVLRFFALLHRRDTARVPFTMFLNDEMDTHRDSTIEDIQRFRWEFSQGMEWTRRIFGTESCQIFRAGDGQNTRGQWQRWNDLIYEVEAVGCAEFSDQLRRVTMDLGDRQDDFVQGLRNRLIEVMCGDVFLDTCREFTRSPANTARRFGLWTDALGNALQDPDHIIEQAGRIRAALRDRPACHECYTPINSFDDSRLLPNSENLAHRYCFKRWASNLGADTQRKAPASS